MTSLLSVGRLTGFGWRLGWTLALVLTLLAERVRAHPMPNSLVLLDIRSTSVTAEVQLPLGELQLAFGHDLAQTPQTLVARLGPQLRTYIQEHVRPVSPDGRVWTVQVADLQVQSAAENSSQNAGTGPYQELTAHLRLQPPRGASSRRFTLNYDVIIHQVVTHTALVSIRQDWEAGVFSEHPVELGVIRLDVPSNTVPPLIINQAGGGLWAGFRGMVTLGMHHIAEGTDHLLFLLALLLPAPLLVAGRRWGQFGGVRYSLIRLLRVVTAFTVGHSLTLLAGAVGWLRLPGQPVEVLIAFSILVSALHAIRPVFSGREAYVAASFGLVHGMAFASTLANLKLPPVDMALSILGFNMGIELMQLLVIVVAVPGLLLLSRTPYYSLIRTGGAICAALASVAWLLERALGMPNPLTALLIWIHPG